MKTKNLAMLKPVAEAFNEISSEFVFVGGATNELYANRPGAPESRETMDVDCFIVTLSRNSYYQLEDKLRKAGFSNDQSPGAPLCRWIYKGVTVDIMPTDENILGFSNPWFDKGLNHTVNVPVGDNLNIKILEAPYYLAAKIAAMESRGSSDLRISLDFEDIIYVLVNRKGILEEIRNAGEDVKQFLSKSFSGLLGLRIIDEAISAAIDRSEPPGTQGEVKSLMINISRL